MQESWIQPLDLEDLLKKGTATPSGILAWTILWREEPGGLQSMWLQTVGHYWATKQEEIEIPHVTGKAKNIKNK